MQEAVPLASPAAIPVAVAAAGSFPVAVAVQQNGKHEENRQAAALASMRKCNAGAQVGRGRGRGRGGGPGHRPHKAAMAIQKNQLQKQQRKQLQSFDSDWQKISQKWNSTLAGRVATKK